MDPLSASGSPIAQELQHLNISAPSAVDGSAAPHSGIIGIAGFTLTHQSEEERSLRQNSSNEVREDIIRAPHLSSDHNEETAAPVLQGSQLSFRDDSITTFLDDHPSRSGLQHEEPPPEDQVIQHPARRSFVSHLQTMTMTRPSSFVSSLRSRINAINTAQFEDERLEVAQYQAIVEGYQLSPPSNIHLIIESARNIQRINSTLIEGINALRTSATQGNQTSQALDDSKSRLNSDNSSIDRAVDDLIARQSVETSHTAIRQNCIDLLRTSLAENATLIPFLQRANEHLQEEIIQEEVSDPRPLETDPLRQVSERAAVSLHHLEMIEERSDVSSSGSEKGEISETKSDGSNPTHPEVSSRGSINESDSDNDIRSEHS